MTETTLFLCIAVFLPKLLQVCIFFLYISVLLSSSSSGYNKLNLCLTVAVLLHKGGDCC